VGDRTQRDVFPKNSNVPPIDSQSRIQTHARNLQITR